MVKHAGCLCAKSGEQKSTKCAKQASVLLEEQAESEARLVMDVLSFFLQLLILPGSFEQ